ncbi:hypothetical protein L6164_022162 [Bauhinia variegata]|uniref:Uncharacterized protein n=1 Tax=Bauhinia variegata TaxID=167791 RepID=A0ACB9MFA7_BAUVA|nr:hypothetical protein L6164_022162 [Bauhinia variegata]
MQNLVLSILPKGYKLPAMASKSLFTCVILLVFLCSFLTRKPCDCSTSANTAGLKEIQNRKLLSALKVKKTNFKTILHGSSSSKFGENSLSWELRKIPSGPDPLHHNGGKPKNVRTP